MKKMKKIFAILLALVMTLALGVTAFATGNSGTNTGTNGTITIDNAAANQTYNIYQIFELESYNYETNNEAQGAYAYTITSTSAWYDFVKAGTSSNAAGAGSAYVTLELLKTDQGVSTYYVTWNSGKSNESDYADFAKLALAYAQDNKNKVTVTATASTTTENITNPSVTKNSTGDDYTIVFSNLSLGYYLVDSSLGALCSLDTTNPSVTIKEKNEKPTVVKTVQENTSYGKTNDANIGDTVIFQTIITAHKGAQNYVLHDKMSAGLTYQNVSSVVLKRSGKNDETLIAKSETVTTEYSENNIKGYMYKVVLNDLEDTDPCDFHIEFIQAYLDTLEEGDQLVVTYTAALNEDAVVGGTGNTNDTKLEYGDNSSTTWDETTTYTWELDVFKHSSNNIALAGAEFKLVKADASGAYASNSPVISFVDMTESEGTPTYRVATSSQINNEDTKTVNTITTTSVSTSPSFKLEGLDAGTYYLVEISAPAGYNKLAEPVKIVISSKNNNNVVTNTETVTYYNYIAANGDYSSAIEAEGNTVSVLNNTGSELPSTGGTGTAIFYILGAILVVGAGVMLVVRRRMSTEK